MVIVLFHVIYLAGEFFLEKCREVYRHRQLLKNNNIPGDNNTRLFKDPYGQLTNDYCEEHQDDDGGGNDDGDDDDDDDDIESSSYCTVEDERFILHLRKCSGQQPSYIDYEDMGDEDAKSEVRFSPPAYIQRYCAVQKILEEENRDVGRLKKIVDFGCSELGFFNYIKNVDKVEEILLVDVDRVTLDLYKKKARPMHCDFLHRRQTHLTVKIFEGSVTQNDKNLENVDAVVGIELIEHLYPDTLDDLPNNIFGFVKPKLAIFTTPNAEFNVLFPNLKGFRHYDHKFEWTRKEFEDWATNIITKFTDYNVTFHGICFGPPGTEHLGALSQMAVFRRKFEYGTNFPGVEGLFKLVEMQEYPFLVDNRTDEQKILDDAIYYINSLSGREDSEMSEEVPLDLVRKLIRQYTVSIDDLVELLRNANWDIENRESGPVVMIPPPSFSSEDNYLDDEYPPDYENVGHEYNGQVYYNLENNDLNNHFVEEESWSDNASVHSTVSANNQIWFSNSSNAMVNSSGIEPAPDANWGENDITHTVPINNQIYYTLPNGTVTTDHLEYVPSETWIDNDIVHYTPCVTTPVYYSPINLNEIAVGSEEYVQESSVVNHPNDWNNDSICYIQPDDTQTNYGGPSAYSSTEYYKKVPLEEKQNISNNTSTNFKLKNSNHLTIESPTSSTFLPNTCNTNGTGEKNVLETKMTNSVEKHSTENECINSNHQSSPNCENTLHDSGSTILNDSACSEDLSSPLLDCTITDSNSNDEHTREVDAQQITQKDLTQDETNPQENQIVKVKRRKLGRKNKSHKHTDK